MRLRGQRLCGPVGPLVFTSSLWRVIALGIEGLAPSAATLHAAENREVDVVWLRTPCRYLSGTGLDVLLESIALQTVWALRVGQLRCWSHATNGIA